MNEDKICGVTVTVGGLEVDEESKRVAGWSPPRRSSWRRLVLGDKEDSDDSDDNDDDDDGDDRDEGEDKLLPLDGSVSSMSI